MRYIGLQEKERTQVAAVNMPPGGLAGRSTVATGQTQHPSQETEKRGNRRPSGAAALMPVVGVALVGITLLLIVGCGDIVVELGSDGAGTSSDQPVETKDDSFIVGPTPRLAVTSFNGSITVTAGPADTIRVQATLRRADKIEYEAVQDGDTVTVNARQEGRTFGRSPGAEIEVTVPPSTGVDLRTSNGMISLDGVQRSGSLRTSNGKIVVDGMTGDLIARTSNGAIGVTGFSGGVELETSNGSVEFDGELTPGSANEMATSNGAVRVTLRGTPSVRLDATTSNSTVTSRLPVLTTSAGDNHLAGTIGDGEAELRVHSSNGSVTIQ